MASKPKMEAGWFITIKNFQNWIPESISVSRPLLNTGPPPGSPSHPRALR